MSFRQHYIWDDSSKARREYAMSGSDFQHQISEFLNLDIFLDRDCIKKIILNATNGFLRKPKSNTKKKGLSNKK